MTEQQSVNFLYDSSRCLAAQHRTLPLVRLEFVDRDLFFPAGVVEEDEPFRGMLVRIQQRREQAMSFSRTGPSRIIERVLDDPNQDAVRVAFAMTRRRVHLRQERTIAQPADGLEQEVLLHARQELGFSSFHSLHQRIAEKSQSNSMFSARKRVK